LATGINTTSLEGTRNWLLANVLRSTDSFSTELAANMTDLVRSNFEINDRVNKAWFIHPGNRWNVPLTSGAQSSLLLTDKLILFAMITLNDGAGNILRRRLLAFSPGAETEPGAVRPGWPASPSRAATVVHEDREMEGSLPPAAFAGRSLLQATVRTQSDEEIFTEALRKITMEPRLGTLPPIQYNVDIPLTAATIFGVEDRAYSLVQLDVFGKFAYGQDSDAMQAVGAEFFRRLSSNLDKFCPLCERIFPVFNNIAPYDGATSSAGRRLLQTQQQQNVNGSYTVLLVFDRNLMNKPIYYTDISKAVYSSSYTPVWSGTSDPVSIKLLWDSLQSQQFVVRRVEMAGSAQ
jgi:hypothetical protein